MTFLAPQHLWSLLAVAALATAYVVLQRRRRHYAVRFTNVELLRSVAPKRPGWRRHVPAAAVALACTALIGALARPVREERVPRDEAVIALVVDVSASMTATDVEPSRLEAAVVAAKDFVADVPEGFHVGLVSYHQLVRVVAAPTTDHAAVIAGLDRLTPGPGTATGDGLLAALESVAAALDDTTATDGSDGSDGEDRAPAATIVLLSDGMATVGTPVEAAAAAAAEQGVPVTTIAYGTEAGTVQVQGTDIPVPADPVSMSAIAERTGGSFFTAASSDELAEVYDDIQARVGYVVEEREILRSFLAAGLVLLLLAVAASMLWNGRFL